MLDMPDGCLPIRELPGGPATWFRDVASLLTFLQRHQGRSWCEIIRHSKPHKIYFDIEVKQGRGSYQDGLDCCTYVIKTLQTMIVGLLPSHIGLWESKYPVGDGKVFSAHIVVGRIITPTQMADLVAYLKHSQRWGEYIDGAPYGSTQLFRLLTQSKPGFPNSPKLPRSLEDVIAREVDTLELEFSMVIHCDGESEVEWEHNKQPPPKPTKQRDGWTPSQTGKDIAEIIVKDNYPPVMDGALVVKKDQPATVKDNQIYLIRVGDFDCEQHGRRHTYKTERKPGNKTIMHGNNANIWFNFTGSRSSWYVRVECKSQSRPGEREGPHWCVRDQELISLLRDIAPQMLAAPEKLDRRFRDMFTDEELNHAPIEGEDTLSTTSTYLWSRSIVSGSDHSETSGPDQPAAVATAASSSTASTATSTTPSTTVSLASSAEITSGRVAIQNEPEPVANGFDWTVKIDWHLMVKKYVGRYLSEMEYQQLRRDVKQCVAIVDTSHGLGVMSKVQIVTGPGFHPDDRCYRAQTLYHFKKGLGEQKCYVPRSEDEIKDETEKQLQKNAAKFEQEFRQLARFELTREAKVAASERLKAAAEAKPKIASHRVLYFRELIDENDAELLFAGKWCVPGYPRQSILTDENGKQWVNTFVGYAAKELGSELMDEELYVICDLLYRHLCEVISDGDMEFLEWFETFLQHMLFDPLSELGRIAVILLGGNGGGKSKILNFIAYCVVGYHAGTFSSPEQFTQKFRGTALEGVLFGIIPELSGDQRNNKVDKETAKTTMTESRIRVENKGKDGHVQENFMHVTMACNEVPSFMTDGRRLKPKQVSDKYGKDKTYMRNLTHHLAKKEVADAFFTILRRKWLRRTEPWDPQVRSGKKSALQDYLTDTEPPQIKALREHRWEFKPDDTPKWLTGPEVYKIYVDWIKLNAPNTHVMSRGPKFYAILETENKKAGGKIFRMEMSSKTKTWRFGGHEPTPVIVNADGSPVLGDDDIDAEYG